MTLLDHLHDLRTSPLFDEAEVPANVTFLTGMSHDEIATLAKTLPCPIPGDVALLLAECRGIDGLLDQIDFSGGLRNQIEADDLFPHGLPIASDGYGNFWIIDLHSHSTTWGPIWFHCHDAPTIAWQSADLDSFLGEVLRLHQPPFASLIDEVHEQRIGTMVTKPPGQLSREEALSSSDALLFAFAQSLPEGWVIADLREAKVGDGFEWGRADKLEVRRYGTAQLWAYKPKRGLFDMLLKRR